VSEITLSELNRQLDGISPGKAESTGSQSTWKPRDYNGRATLRHADNMEESPTVMETETPEEYSTVRPMKRGPAETQRVQEMIYETASPTRPVAADLGEVGGGHSGSGTAVRLKVEKMVQLSERGHAGKAIVDQVLLGVLDEVRC
jgi:hypothetical protein